MIDTETRRRQKREANRRYAAKNREYLRGKQKEYYEQHPERRKAANLKNYAKHRDKIKARQRAYANTPEGHAKRKESRAKNEAANPQRVSVWSIRSRSKKPGGYEADVGYLYDMECPTTCPVFGTPLAFTKRQGKRDRKLTASFDRIDSRLGYVSGNVQIISLKANAMKQDATVAELIQFADWIYRTYGTGVSDGERKDMAKFTTG